MMCGVLVSVSLHAQPAKTEQEVLHAFLQSNLSLIAGKMEIDLAKAEVLTASQWNNPQISLNVAGLGQAKGYDGDYWRQPYDNVLRIEQLIETAGKRQLRIDAASLNAQTKELLFKDLLRSLIRDVKQAYYQVVHAQRNVAIYDQIWVQMNEVQQANALRWKAGDISETEFRRTELESLKAKNDVELSYLKLDTVRMQLAELLSHGSQWQELEVVTHYPEHRLDKMSHQTWLDKAIARRADLAASALQIEQRSKLVSLAEKQKIPNVTLGMQYQHNISNAVPDSVGIGISVELPLWHGYEGEVAAAKANKRLSDIAWQQLSVQIKTQVETALAVFKQKQMALARFDQVTLAYAQQVHNSSLLAYRQGAISLLELLDADRSYRNALLDYNQSLLDQELAWLDLMYAVGEEA
jgi:cobalt-zinc-cadmium efflux system outer membrane protein